MGNAEEIQKVENLVTESRLQAKTRELDFQKQQLLINKELLHFNRVVAVTGAVVSVVMILTFLADNGILIMKNGIVQLAIIFGAGMVMMYILPFLKKHILP